ncbi:nucleotidyltransferase domain-containing protein [Pseudalkalibacillus hwajinpoensis]|uniref:DNA polymerase beta superfamily protein n=1 Tax=Guptibacillus hwajinpoensis TaxID=208199 RepID=UPI00325BAED7
MTDILEILNDIEVQSNVKVLYACEAGSRAFGYETEESDHDVRFIYVHPRDWYLTVFPRGDVLEVKDGNIEVHGWDLQKTLQLLAKSNPSLLEWLASPIIYKEENIKEIRDLGNRYFSLKALLFHYVKMGQTNLREYKKYSNQKFLIYALKSILIGKWVVQTNSMPAHSLKTMLQSLEINNFLRENCVKLLSREVIKDSTLLETLLETELFQLENTAHNIQVKSSVNHDEIDGVFRSILSR